MSETRDTILAQIAVERGYVGQEQIDEALKVQRTARDELGLDQDLATILVARKVITLDRAEELRQAVAIQTGDARRIGGYEVVAKLGAGGMGSVYEAVKVGTQERVALKILPPSIATDEMIKRFQRESAVTTRLDHENIVRCLEFGQDAEKGMWFSALELVEGEDLESLIDREGVLPEEQAVSITRQIAMALQHAHFNNLVHRDVKPGNIMVTPDGTAKLLDLGLARTAGTTAEATQLTQSGLFVGSPYYASPEQATSEQDLDTRSDIYSLGATVYHMVTGKPPYGGKSTAQLLYQHVNEMLEWPADLNPELSDDFCLVIARMMAKDPADRYQAPKELLAHLDQLEQGADVSVDDEVLRRSSIKHAAIPRPRRRPRRRKPRKATESRKPAAKKRTELKRKKTETKHAAGPGTDTHSTKAIGAPVVTAGAEAVEKLKARAVAAWTSFVAMVRRGPPWLPYAMAGGGGLFVLVVVLVLASGDDEADHASIASADDRTDVAERIVSDPPPVAPDAPDTPTPPAVHETGPETEPEPRITPEPAPAPEKPARALPVASPAFDLARGLIGHWAFDEGRGNVARDSSGNGLHGAVVGGARLMPALGVSGGALSTRTKGDGIELSMHAATFATLRAGTLSLWVNMNAHQPDKGMPLFTVGTTNHEDGFFIFAHWKKALWCELKTRSAQVYKLGLGRELATNVWYLWTFTVGPEGTAAYLNGEALAVTYRAGARGSTGFLDRIPARRVAIGSPNAFDSKDWISGFHGLIDDVRVYDRALSADEARALFEARAKSAPGRARGLVADADRDAIFNGLNMDGWIRSHHGASWVQNGILHISRQSEVLWPGPRRCLELSLELMAPAGDAAASAHVELGNTSPTRGKGRVRLALYADGDVHVFAGGRTLYRMGTGSYRVGAWTRLSCRMERTSFSLNVNDRTSGDIDLSLAPPSPGGVLLASGTGNTVQFRNVRVSSIDEPDALADAADDEQHAARRAADAEPATDVDATARDRRPPPTIVLDLGGGERIDLAYIEPGMFTMGGLEEYKDPGFGLERPEHDVTITRGFYLGVREVTRGQFAAFVKAARYKTEAEKKGYAHAVPPSGRGRRTQGVHWRNPMFFVQDDTHPVIAVDWNDAAAFCEWASRKTRRAVRLPTEAEWEYACRAASTEDWTCGDSDVVFGEHAWYARNAGMRTHPVGRKKANAWGLHDMHGNVMEWVADRYADGYYATSPGTDPAGPRSGAHRVLRGGGWPHDHRQCRSAARAYLDPTDGRTYTGFRVAVTVEH